MEQSKAYGELVLQFTTQFRLRWQDRKSHGKHDGSFWQPVVPAGFRAFGSIGIVGYDDPSGEEAALCARETTPGSGALRAPDGYELIWGDHRSGATLDGSCWRPVPPAGYVALGDVFVRGYDPPSLDDAVCVRIDLVGEGVIGELIWDDTKTHAKEDFGAWQVVTPARYVDPTRGLFAVNSFVGAASHTKPSEVVYNLCLPFPIKACPTPAAPPVLTSRSAPLVSQTVRQVDHAVWVPCTAIRDPEHESMGWKVKNSPFYLLEREVWYDLLLFDDNTTDTPQIQDHSESVGISISHSEAFSESTGVVVTTEAGVRFMGVGSKVSATVTEELGYSNTTGIELFASRTVTVHLTTPPKTAADVWAASYAFRLKRGDERTTIPAELDFTVDSFFHSQFPPATVQGQEKAMFFELPPIAERVPA